MEDEEQTQTVLTDRTALAVAIVEGIYKAYGTDTGVLFGIPVSQRGSVNAIVKLTIEYLLRKGEDNGRE